MESKELVLGHNEICRRADVAPGTASTYIADGKPVPTRDGSREINLADLRGADGKYRVPPSHPLYEELCGGGQAALQGGGTGVGDGAAAAPTRERPAGDGERSGRSRRSERSEESAPSRENPSAGEALSERRAELERKKLEYEARERTWGHIEKGLAGTMVHVEKNPDVLPASAEFVCRIATPLLTIVGGGIGYMATEGESAAVRVAAMATLGWLGFLAGERISGVKARSAHVTDESAAAAANPAMPESSASAPAHSGDGHAGVGLARFSNPANVTFRPRPITTEPNDTPPLDPGQVGQA